MEERLRQLFSDPMVGKLTTVLVGIIAIAALLTDFPFLWDEIKLPIKYGSDYRLARQIIQQAGDAVTGDYAEEARTHWEQMLRKFLIEDATTQPMVTLVATDNWVEYTLRYVVDYKKRRSIKDLLFARILEEVDQTGSKVQFASATFEMVELPTLDVSLKEPQG